MLHEAFISLSFKLQSLVCYTVGMNVECTAELSPPMSNQWDKEEAHLLNWLICLQYVEGMLDLLLHLN